MKHAMTMRFAALLASASFVIGLVGTPAYAAGDTSDCTTSITSGNVDWGIKESFRNYVKNTGIGGDGKVTTTGVTGEYSWPLDAAASTVANFQTGGTVRYEKHHGVLDMTFSGVEIVMAGSQWMLKADVSSKDQASGEVRTYSDITLADLTGAKVEEQNGATTIRFTSAILTEAGSPAFGGFYKAGDSLDVPVVTYMTKTTCPTPQPARTSESVPATPAATPTSPAEPSATASANPTSPAAAPSTPGAAASAARGCTPWSAVAGGDEAKDLKAGSSVVTDAKLTWGISQYAQTWKGEGDNGGVAYDAQTKTFTLVGGTGTTDGKAATVTWRGDFKLYPYANMAFPGMESMAAMNFHFADPKLSVAHDGSGTLVAKVSSTAMAGVESAAAEVPLANFPAGSFTIIAGADGTYTFSGAPAYEGQTYTYSAMNRRTGEVESGTAEAAWPSEFIDAVDSSLRAYWYKSGAKADPTKPPLEVSGSFRTVTPTMYTWNDGNETLKTEILSTCEERPEPPANPVREGYVFDGWDEAATAEGVAYSALWKREAAPEPSAAPTAQADSTAIASDKQSAATGEPAAAPSSESSASPRVGAAKSPPAAIATTAVASGKKECEADPTKTRVTSGSLNWGLRQSFTSYIRGGIAKGEITGSAWKNNALTFTAIGGTFDTEAKTGEIYFSGDARFTGHKGVLDMTIGNARLVFSGNDAELYLDVKSNDSAGKEVVNAKGVRFATLKLSKLEVSNTTLVFEANEVALTAEGAKAFSGFYSAGEKLDPLNGSATLTPDSTCDPVTGDKTSYDGFGNKVAVNGVAVSASSKTGALSRTGMALGMPLGVGALLALAGAAGVLLARRVRE